jgi:hypothetical protein
MKHTLVDLAQHDRRQRQHHKARPLHADRIAKHAEQQRREETAEATERANQSGNGAGVAREALGHQLEHRAVAEAEQRRAA